MNLKFAGIIIFLTACGIVVSDPERAVDCRKFVFAPLCRGVAAKRDPSGVGRFGPGIYTNEERQRWRNPYFGLSSLGVPDDDIYFMGELTSQEEALRLAKMYQQIRSNRNSGLFLEKRRSNSERDNFRAQDFEDI